MDKLPTKQSSFSFPEAIRWLLGIGAVVIISFLYPNNLQFPYEFERGQTWRYPTLHAPYEFPVLKVESQLEADRQEVIANLTPVYRIKPEVAREAKAAFLRDFEEQLDSIQARNTFPGVQRSPEEHRKYGLLVLDKIFSNGIIDSGVQADPAAVISIANGNEVREATISSLYTLADAQRWLTDSLPYSNLKAPDFILPLLDDRLAPNLAYSDSLSNRFREQSLMGISPYSGLVNKDDLIISKGSLITDNIYQQLLSYREKYNTDLGEGGANSIIFTGYALLTALVILLLFLYLRHFFPRVYGKLGKLVFVMMWPVLYALIIRAVEGNINMSAYVVPFCIVPIVIRIFFNERLAFFVHVSVVLIASFLTTLGYEFTFLQILAGIIVLLSNVDTRDWNQFFYSMLYIFLAYALAWTGLSLIQEGTWETIDLSVYPWIFLNVLFTLLAYPLIPLLERFFGFTSSISLMELSDMNRPLLRELALKAPGTLQHSLQVANLAEAAAQRIGANPLLVKVAALYHDIGKTAKPEYYIENQSGKNPHNDISDLESAKIIIEHVTEGLQMAKKFRLPNVITDFIKTHHGTTRVEYFYRNHLKAFPEHNFDESLFRYPGPRPSSKEETILMLADS
ncbi:MAG: HDIG domain-containing metalloprotein, partial [Bacteroidota bacterium]